MLGAFARIAVAAVALAAQASGGAAAGPGDGAPTAAPSVAPGAHFNVGGIHSLRTERMLADRLNRARFNVGGTHSPRTERLLAGGPNLAQVKQPNPGDVLGIDVASGQHAGGA